MLMCQFSNSLVSSRALEVILAKIGSRLYIANIFFHGMIACSFLVVVASLLPLVFTTFFFSISLFQDLRLFEN